MGIWDAFSDLVAAAMPVSSVEAEAVSGGSSEEKTPAQKHEEDDAEVEDPDGPTPDKRSNDNQDQLAAGKEASGNNPDDKYGPAGEKDEKEDEDEEEEDEEEIVDPKEKFEEECRESKQCSAPKHHFDECIERVTGAAEGAHDKKHPNEDCVEEFFHLTHCATQCAAPKLWSVLK